jgi:inhibitor of the pro-sigma K processing machinery
MEKLSLICLAVVGVLLLVLLFKLFRTTLKWALKLLFNAIIGFAALLLLNYVGAPLGISLNLNWFNAIVTGILGVPGVILLLLIKYLL